MTNSQLPRLEIGSRELGLKRSLISSWPPSSFRPLLSSPFESPLSPVVWMASVAPDNPAHSAAWHVGPGVGDLAFVRADSRSHRPSSLYARADTTDANERAMLRDKKNGVLHRAPLEALRKIYRFFAAFFFPPLAAFFAIVFSSGCAAQPPTDRVAVTTGGLSHPPSYQM